MNAPSFRRPGLWVVLALVLSCAAWLGQSSDDELLASSGTRASRPARSAPTGQRAQSAPGALAGTAALKPDAWWQVHHAVWLQRASAAVVDPASARGGEAWQPWQPPVLPRVAGPADVTQELAPQAPPFPHAWVGRVVDDVPRAVISGPQRTWVLQAGDVIDGQWRLDTLGERQLGFTYLPLQQTVQVSARTSASP